jgi:hypothetical protein
MAGTGADARRLFVGFLEEARDAAISDQLRLTYMRAIKSLKEFRGPISSGSEAKVRVMRRRRRRHGH